MVLRFWGSAAAVTVAFTLAALLWLPYDVLGLAPGPERIRAWLLTLWTGGVLAILFGASALISHGTGVGVRDVAEAGSLRSALEARRAAGKGERAPFHRNFGWWCVCTGLLMVAVYFGCWLAVG